MSGIFAAFLGTISLGTLVYLLLSSRRQASISALLDNAYAGGGTADLRDRLTDDASGRDYEKLKKAMARRSLKRKAPTLEEKFFHAGLFSDKARRKFYSIRLLAPPLATAAGAALGFRYFSLPCAISLTVLGLLLGFQIPISWLNRRIASRNEEIMYYLPLVIEQIVIGVSSSLDIGPCIQRVVLMSEERDTYNPVTELLRYAQHYVKSGVSLNETLVEIGRLSGHVELKHVFLSLAQVSKHGGEISKQLQELADAVAAQRETRIEGKIKRLELEATGPVALVFVGFLMILMIGFSMRFIQVFRF